MAHVVVRLIFLFGDFSVVEAGCYKSGGNLERHVDLDLVVVVILERTPEKQSHAFEDPLLVQVRLSIVKVLVEKDDLSSELAQVVMFCICKYLGQASPVFVCKGFQSLKGLEVYELLFYRVHSLETQEFVVHVDHKGFGGACVMSFSRNKHTLEGVNVVLRKVERYLGDLQLFERRVEAPFLSQQVGRLEPLLH